MPKIKIPNFPLGPFPIALAGTLIDNKPGYTTVGAWGCVCQEPVLYVSLKNDHYTTAGVRNTGYFSLNIPSDDLVRQTDYCGLVSGGTYDKSRLFTTFYDEIDKAPMIEECPLNILCEVIRRENFFDFEMFLGKIVAMYISPDCLTNGKPDPVKIHPLILMCTSYLASGAAVGRIYDEGKKLKLP